MQTPTGRIQPQIELLFDQLSHGWLFYLCAKSLSDAFEAHRITCAFYFFTGAFMASLNETILSLSKLLEQSESVSVNHLLRYAEQNPLEFMLANPATIRNAIQGHKVTLKSFSTLQKNVKTQRDKVIAHLDKMLLTGSTAITIRPYIDMNEVERCYRELLKILNVYSGYAGAPELRVENIDEGVPDDLDFILSLIDAANAKPEDQPEAS